MKKHFVTFLSPGTFLNEETTLPIDFWDILKASDMAHGITERHGATPFGFYFTTRSRSATDLDSKVIKRSGTYFLGGEVKTLSEVEAMNDPKNGILLSNMRCNKWDKVIFNANSWKIVQPFTKKDTLLDWNPKPKGGA